MLFNSAFINLDKTNFKKECNYDWCFFLLHRNFPGLSIHITLWIFITSASYENTYYGTNGRVGAVLSLPSSFHTSCMIYTDICIIMHHLKSIHNQRIIIKGSILIVFYNEYPLYVQLMYFLHKTIYHRWNILI
jgi:hypothetical protein